MAVFDKALINQCMQELPSHIHNLPGTGQRSGRPLPFPQLSYVETHPHDPFVKLAAYKWMKCCLMQCTCLTVTPMRASWPGSSAHPKHVPEKCPLPHCTVKGCRGNAFYKTPSGYILDIPHHKNSSHSK